MAYTDPTLVNVATQIDSDLAARLTATAYREYGRTTRARVTMLRDAIKKIVELSEAGTPFVTADPEAVS